MNDLARASFLSYLDLIANTFGGALLLFLLIAATANDRSPQASNEEAFVLIRCRHGAGPKIEIGIEFRRPGSTEWERATDDSWCFHYQALADVNSGAEAFLLLKAPSIGTWEFRPYSVDFAKGKQGGAKTIIEFDDPIGDGIRSERLDRRTNEIIWPGDAGPPIYVRISAR